MDMAEISTANKPMETDADAIPKIPHITINGEDTATSESRFAIPSENINKHHSSPVAIPQSHISAVLESNTSPLKEKITIASRSDHVTFGNNHSSISSQMCKTTSGEANTQNWGSSTLSKDIILNADPTASANISGKGHISSISFEDGSNSPSKETVAVLENITTMAGDPCAAPTNMATNEDTIAASSGVSFISTTILGDSRSANNSEEAIPDPGSISNIFSGEKTAGSVDTFSAVSTGDTTATAPSLSSVLVFVDTSDTQEALSPLECSTTDGDVTIVPGDFTASHISDSGEISHITFKKDSTSVSEDTTVLLQGGTAGVFTTETSAIVPPFPTTTEYIASDQSLPVISGSTVGFPCNESNTAVKGAHVTRGCLTDGNKTGTIFREANTSNSAVPTTEPGGACKASTEGLNVCRKINNTASLKTTGCNVTTESGNTSVITGKSATAFGNISITHLDTATINESFLIIPGNVTDTAGSRDTTTVTPRNTTGTFGKISATSMTQGDTSAIHDGETSTIISSGHSMKTANRIEKVTADSEDPTIESNSIMVSGDSNATVCIAIAGVVGNTAREDFVATTPGHTDIMEPSSSPQNGIIIVAGQNCNTTRKKSSGDSTTQPPFGGSTVNPDTVGTSTTAAQGYAFTNPAGHATVSCGSIIVSEGSVGDKATAASFGGGAIPGNDVSMMQRENNSSVFDDASITSSFGETFMVYQDTALNIATPILSQNACVYSAEVQVGQYSETITRKTSTVFGKSTNTHRDTDTTKATLTSPTNTVIPAAAITSTTNILENGNTATSRRPTPISQNTNDMISEEVTASTMSEDVTEYMTSRNMATIHFENAVTTAATFVASGESESTSITSLAPRETTCSTENDAKKTSSGSTFSYCVPTSVTGELPATIPEETPISIEKPILEFTTIHGDTPNAMVSPDSTSAHNIVQVRKRSVATIADDRKPPSDTTMVVPGDISTGPATILSVLSREINTGTLEDVANNTSDSASINATSSGDTSEDAHYNGRITSGHNGTQTILGCVSTPDSSFSVRTHFQEASKGPGDTTTVFGSTIKLLEGAQFSHEFASMHSEVPTTLVQTPEFNDTAIILGGNISTEASRQRDSTPTANAASTSVDDKIHSETPNTPVTLGTKNITSHKGAEILIRSLILDSISSPVFSGIFEATPIPEENRHTTAISDANSDAAIITSTKSKEASAARASGDFMKTTTLMKDTTTFTTTSTGVTTTVTVLKDTVMTTQTSTRDIATVSRNKTTPLLEDTSTAREIVTSEKIAATTLGDVTTHSKVLIPGTRTCGGTPKSNIPPKETLGNDPSDYYILRITTDSVATANITNILSDTISTSNNANSMLEIISTPERILASRNNCTTTLAGISIQSPTTIPEAPSIVTEKASFASQENITIITTSEARVAHPVPKDATMTNTPEDETNSDVTINNSENITNVTGPSVSPREADVAACIPLHPTSSAFGKTGQRFYPGNAANTNTSLEEVCAHPDYPAPTEAFSTLASASHSVTRQLVELVTPCLSTVSVSENTSRTSETSTCFGNATAPILSLQGTAQSIATGDPTTSITTTGIAAFADPKTITAPGDRHTFIRTTPNESRESIATGTLENIPTTFGATYTGGKATGTDVAKYVIATPIVSEDTITAPGDNNTDLVIPRDKNTVTAAGNIHARTSTAHGEATNADKNTASGPTTYKAGASLIPTCPAMISLRETLTPSATTTSEDTGSLAATAAVEKPPTIATTVVLGENPTPEATMVVEETAVSGIITNRRETFVPKITTSFTEAPISRSATKFSLASSSEATIFPADGATFFSGQTAACTNTSSNKSTADEDIIAATAHCSTSSFVSTPFTPCNVGRKALVFEDSVCSAAGHPHHSANTTYVAEKVASTVPEDTTIVSGNHCTLSEDPVTITLSKGTDSPTKETFTTTEGDFIIATGMSHTAKPGDMTDTTTTESSVTIPRRTTVVLGETPVITPGEKITTTYTTTKTTMIIGGTSDEMGKILTATRRETNIATFEKAMDSTTRVSFVASGETLAISPRETPAATSGEITGTTCTFTSQTSDVSREDVSATPEETLVGIPREAAIVKLGKAPGTITRETPTIIRRKTFTTDPQKTFVVANSRVSPPLAPGEAPTAAFAEVMDEASPFSPLRNDKPMAVASEDTFIAAPSKTASASQEKNRTLKPVTPLPYWSIMLIGITVIVFLAVGFCMAMYYVTFFILVAYSASLSSNTCS